jgi:hypothetical protein
MKRMLVIFVSCFFMLVSCNWHRIHGNGSIRSDDRNAATFDGISIDGGYEVQINCQEKQSVKIETDENLLSHIKTEVKNNVLHIETEGNLSPTKGIKVRISIPDISEFTVNGSAEGNINKISNQKLDLVVHGSSKLNMEGKSNNLNISIHGSSKIDATTLVSENSKIEINGSGNIHVNATNSIDVHINGSGTVKYKGEPKDVKQQINGSGKIEKE